MPEDLAKVYLEVRFPDRSLKIPLDGDAICRIGRANPNTVLLDGDLVSRYHAVIQRTETDGYLLADLGSRNGTYVNDARVQAPVLLEDGDCIVIGGHALIFRRLDVNDSPSDEAPALTNALFRTMTVSVLVADIRGFTSMWSNLESTTASRAMVAFNAEVGALLRQEHVWAQKYSGDGVMALWVHDQFRDALKDLQRHIIRSVVGIAEVARGLQVRFTLPSAICVGAGVDAGPAILGNIGSEASADHSALGDTVNRAFRLEAATRDVGCDILFSEEAYGHVRELAPAVDFEPKSVSLKGFSQPVRAYAGSFQRLWDVMANDSD